MKLKRIIENLNGVEKIEGRTSLEIKGLTCNSKTVRDGYLFIAISGTRFNGVDFIDEAVDRGANVVLLDMNQKSKILFKRPVTYIYVKEVRQSLSYIARSFYNDPLEEMYLIGVTGTNGKTTTTYLLESLFKKRKEKVGIIGTINYRFGDRIIPACNTTPDVLDLYYLLSSMYREKIKNCILEVSSHSLEQKRVDSLLFDIAVFTNLAKEHLDYHKTVENYFDAKMKLFTKIKKNGWAIINKDDAYSQKVIDKVRSQKEINIITYGIKEDADIYAKDIKFSFEGLKFMLLFKDGLSAKISSSLLGRYNVYNILASAACGKAMGMNLDDIASGIEALSALPGRLERIDCKQDFSVFVDYAHTEDGLEKVLTSLRELKPNRLFCVLGCGGERDISKRSKMGRVSSELSDRIFITSDNPRSEEPMAIIKNIIEGIDKKKNNYVIEPDRFKAIEKALIEAKKDDIVLVAGKGHETYQIFKDTTVPFDDREVVRKILNNIMV